MPQHTSAGPAYRVQCVQSPQLHINSYTSHNSQLQIQQTALPNDNKDRNDTKEIKEPRGPVSKVWQTKHLQANSSWPSISSSYI